jgi:hypothetical protein
MTDTPAPSAPLQQQWMRNTLAVLSTIMFAGALFLPAFRSGVQIDPNFKGALVLQWGLVMGWYFGSSQGSAMKDQALAQMSSSMTPTQLTTTQTGNVSVNPTPEASVQ